MVSTKLEKEQRLVKQCLKGERQAQHELFMLYKDAMYTIVLRMMGNKEEAEDILQEGFVSVFNNLGSYRGEGALGGWMKTIFVRLALRKLSNKKFTSDIDEHQEGATQQDEHLTGELLEKLIQGLDKGYRTVLLLVEVEGYKHKEVAEMLGISEGTSKSQLSRAKAILREKLKKIGYE